MVLFGPLLYQFVRCFVCVNVTMCFQLSHLTLFDSQTFYQSLICVEFYFGIVSMLIFFWNVLLEFGCFTDSMIGPYSAVLLLRFLLKIRSGYDSIFGDSPGDSKLTENSMIRSASLILLSPFPRPWQTADGRRHHWPLKETCQTAGQLSPLRLNLPVLQFYNRFTILLG